MTIKLQPTPTSGSTGNKVVRVDHGNVSGSLEDDKAFVQSEGTWTASIGRKGFSAGYLRARNGPLLTSLGTPQTPSKVALSEARKVESHLSAVERFDLAFKHAKGVSGSLTERYRVEGSRPHAQGWEGYCNRWALASLDPEVGPKLNEARVYQGVYFSIADQRGLATFLGEQNLTFEDLEVQHPSVVDLQKAMVTFLQKDGSGFVADKFNDEAERLRNPAQMAINPTWHLQVWNQPVHSVEQEVKLGTAGDIGEAMSTLGRDELPEGAKVYRVKTKLTYGSEAFENETDPDNKRMDNYEGPVEDKDLKLDYFLVVNTAGQVIDGTLAKTSDPLPDSLWVPGRGEKFKTPEGAFMRELINRGVSHAKVTSFEDAMARFLTIGKPVSAEQKETLRHEFVVLANAYGPGELDERLKTLGLSAADFK